MQNDQHFKNGRVVLTWLAIFCVVAVADAQVRVDKNVVYGMYSGTALLLDVHYPERANGFGIIFISGSGWNAPLGYELEANWKSMKAGRPLESIEPLAKDKT